MKILIVYASETGVTRSCAEELAKILPASTLVDLAKEKPDPNPYDIIAVGSSIRMGAMNKHAAEYLENCASILETKRLGVFLTCGYDERAGMYFKSELPESLHDLALKMSFGGKLDPDGAKGLDRFMIKLMLKSQKKSGETMAFHPERIQEFAAKLIDTNCAS